MDKNQNTKKRKEMAGSVSEVVPKTAKTKKTSGVKSEPKRLEKVFALSLRPSSLSNLIGQDAMKDQIQKQVNSGRLPHFYLLEGPVGCGKTTFARILANEIIEDADIKEINAANQNGVDDVRSLVANMKFLPVYPKKTKVVILDEAHQLTNAAQNALITETEDVPNHVYYIFCTSNLSKIIPALKRRAFIVSPEPLQKESSRMLVELAINASDSSIDDTGVNQFVDSLHENGITSPGLVLQAVERFLSGMSVEKSVLLTNSDTTVDTIGFCRALSSGNWKSCKEMLKDSTKTDIPALRNCALGYLKKVLLNSSETKCVSVAKAINHLSADSIRADDGAALPMFIASVALACSVLSR